MAPPVEPAKRVVAPKQLAKLDLESERQKSIRQVSVDGSSPEKKKKVTKKTKNASDEAASASTPADKTAKTKEKPTKAGKVAPVSGEDHFNDLRDLPRPATADPTGRPSGKPSSRPASAGILGSKRAQYASGAGGRPNGNSSNVSKPGSAVVAVKPAFEKNREGEMDDSDDDGENKRSMGDTEPPAMGLYDIFVHTRRCETVCFELGLKLKDIRRMKKKFDENDMYHTGEITQAEFYYIINDERRPLTKGVLRYGRVANDQKFMSFDEYLLCVVSFASLTPPEVYQYAFDLYDADKSGTLDEYEFARMSKEMQSQQFCFPKNVETAIKMIGGNGLEGGGLVSEDGLVDLHEFMKFAKLFPVAFFPLFNFQTNVRRATLGERKWSNLAARKLKIQELVSHMRRNFGAVPELSLGARLMSIVDDEIMEIRKRASEIYAKELAQRRLIGDTNDADDNAAT